MIINDHSIQLKTFDESDESIRRITEIPEVAKNLTERWMYPAGMPDSMVFAIFYENQIAGSCGLKTIRWFNRKAELSLFLDPAFHRKGIGTNALIALMKHAFYTMNFYRLEAEVIEYNQNALSLVRKLGFVEEGRLRQAKYFEGKYYDIFRFGILKNEFEDFLSKKINHETAHPE